MAAALFKEYDRNNDGSLSLEEMRQALEGLGCFVTTKRLCALIALVDANSDGTLQLAEFEHLVYIIQHADLAREESVLFYAIDTDHSGTIDGTELREILERTGFKCSEGRIERFVDEACHGALTADTFTTFVRALRRAVARRAPPLTSGT
ncbi:Calmodulin [Giardia muris]|uniref:Calmodulin n=1 Tax=Giardia muris TaxID=5742 RepID=A0A4Z1SZW6_GIAMU|nr:Calmodulin [Giardia muris]|eukprot:TNJ30285.1 Calmodulin [Giardia muris]